MVDLQVYVNSVTGTGPPRYPDIQSCLLSVREMTAHGRSDIYRLVVQKKKKKKGQKEAILSDIQKPS